MSSSSAPPSTPEGPGSVSGAPNLPAGFTDTFTSRYVDAGGLRQHAAIGGDGPPLLLVHGWPENWYAWRLVMPALARDFEVIAPDQRGIGLTDKPRDASYDPGTLANDMVALMDALGHQRFAVVGTDTGLPISYALAADHPDRVERVALAEVPGPPGAVPQPPFFLPEPLNNKLWHIPVNRLDELNEQLARGGRTCTSATSSTSRPKESSRPTWSTTTSGFFGTPTPCTAPSRSTASGTR
jgi:pimeloyl-ACP methyl ester carboxylesterase